VFNVGLSAMHRRSNVHDALPLQLESTCNELPSSCLHQGQASHNVLASASSISVPVT